MHNATRSTFIRIAAPPGLQEFSVGDNHLVPIPITENMVTPVEIRVRSEHITGTRTETHGAFTLRTPVRRYDLYWIVGDPKPVTPLQ